MTNNRNMLKAGVVYTFANIFLKSVSIITAPIFTRLLTTSDYGVVNNFISWQNIVFIITGLCLSYSIGNAKIDFKDDFDGYISSIQILSTMVATIFLVIAIVCRVTLADFMELDESLVISLFVYLIFYPSIEYEQTRLRFAYRYKENVFMAMYITLGSVFLSLVLIIFSSMEAYMARILGTIIPSFAIAFICWGYIFYKGSFASLTKYWKYALKISLPMIPHSLAMIVLGQIDRIMIVKYIGNAEAGIYSFGYSYGVIGAVVINAVGQAWQPWLYEKISLRDFFDIREKNNVLNYFIAGCVIIFVFLAPEVLMLLSAEPFWEAKWVVAPVAIGTYYQYLYNNFSQIELFMKKTVWIAMGSLAAAGMNYYLNLLMLPIYGYQIAAVTTLIGYGVLAVYHGFFSYMALGNFVYDIKNIVINILLVTGLGICAMLLYDEFLLRYFILFGLLILIISKANKIRNTYISLKRMERN